MLNIFFKFYFSTIGFGFDCVAIPFTATNLGGAVSAGVGLNLPLPRPFCGVATENLDNGPGPFCCKLFDEEKIFVLKILFHPDKYCFMILSTNSSYLML